MLQNKYKKFGVVVIGRNEGMRLEICLTSVVNPGVPVIYVDSGSSDASVTMARSLGVAVVELDMTMPFTAARARNEGVNCLLAMAPELDYIQFVDGDCEVAQRWLEQAVHFLDAQPQVAVVYGRRRERYPERSIYNLMCDIEWNRPLGQTDFCGGDALMRTDAFTYTGGYRSTLIAGEEPELCVRMRALGWKIWRIDAEMVLHDAAMFKFSQWWRRCTRSGHAFAEGAYLHGAPPERLSVRSMRSNWFWGLGLPIFIIFMAFMCSTLLLALVLVYPAQVVRIALRDRKSLPAPWWHALFLVAGRFPEMLGQSKFVYSRIRGQATRLIEYK